MSLPLHLDLLDAQLEGARRSLDGHHIAYLVVHKSLADRGVERQFPVLVIHLVGTHDGEGHNGVRGQIREFHAAQKAGNGQEYESKLLKRQRRDSPF